ncbi:hypothetical protein M5K25_017941 [Dendrobium thyrsiflorum]|uniref:Uncharacterized protein n=1 Tax=Dendrobium thyrsiflorum TaxID=117978 RepID=A0ABD0UGZ6_DENTH
MAGKLIFSLDRNLTIEEIICGGSIQFGVEFQNFKLSIDGEELINLSAIIHKDSPLVEITLGLGVDSPISEMVAAVTPLPTVLFTEEGKNQELMIIDEKPPMSEPESHFSWRKLEERDLSLRGERVEIEREKSLGEGVWRGFYTVAPASSHRSTSKSRFVLREVLKKKTALVSKDQVLCLLQEEEKEVSCTSDRQKTSKLGRIGNLLQSVLAEVLCLHRGVVKKEVAVLCRRKEEGSLPSPRSGEKGSVAVLCRRKEEGSLPSPRSGEKGSVAVLCRRKEEGFSAITV